MAWIRGTLGPLLLVESLVLVGLPESVGVVVETVVGVVVETVVGVVVDTVVGVVVETVVGVVMETVVRVRTWRPLAWDSSPLGWRR